MILRYLNSYSKDCDLNPIIFGKHKVIYSKVIFIAILLSKCLHKIMEKDLWSSGKEK